MIWAQSPEGVIGAGGTIPWRYPGDLRRFKRVTLGSTIVMGRATFESMGRRALPGRRNVVVTRSAIEAPGIESVRSLDEALALAAGNRGSNDASGQPLSGDARSGVQGRGAAGDDVWFIGGARIYAEAMAYADVIDVVYVPDHIAAADVVHAPVIDERVFEPSPLVPHEDEPSLTRRTYQRR